MLTVSIAKRDKTKKLEDLRSNGNIPAVFYGRKEQSTPISINQIEFMKVWKEAGESSVIELKGESESHEALIHDIDLDPVTSVVRHVDFYVIEKGKKLEVSVELDFVGVSPAVKDLGGILVKVLHEVEIESLPKDLPKKLTVDISKLTDFDSKILAKDIVLPAGVVLIDKEDEVVASVARPKEEVVETAPVDISSIEVEKKGKEAKDGEVAPVAEPAK